jgi:phage tail sheath gpL-like
MTVSFDRIPLNILTPGVYVEADASRAVQGVSQLPQDVLILGQQLSTGTATAAQVYAVDSADQAKVLFGTTSMIAQAIAAYKAVDSLTPVFAAAVADNGTTKATGSITWSGTATAAGELALYVGGRRISVAVANGDTASAVETTALAAVAITADLPVTTAGDSGTGLDFPAVNAGTQGNQIMLGHSLMDGEAPPAGLTMTVTAMSGGATDPSYSTLVTAMGEDQYGTVVTCNDDATALGLLVTEMEDRFGPMRAIDGSIFAAHYDTQANLTTKGNALNSAMLVLVGAEKSALLPLPWELAAMVAALDALQAQTDPARACTGLLIPGARGAARGSRFTRAQRNTLLSDGVSTVVCGRDGRLAIDRLVTTYQTNASSIPDTAYQDQQTVRLLSAIRYSARVRVGTRFARFKLTSDGSPIPPGQPMTNPKGIKAELCALASEWVQLGWMENLAQFVAEVFVERDGTDQDRVNAVLPPDFVNNLLVTAMKISFRK